MRKTSSTGKGVEKRYILNNEVIDTYETITKAAESEKIAPCKMSRSIKHKEIFNDDYYFTIKYKSTIITKYIRIFIQINIYKL